MGRVRQSRFGSCLGWVAAAAVMGLTSVAAPRIDAAPYVAGVQPDQRPAGAPTITAYDKSGKWQANATHGVTAPVPPHVTKFLADQGAWYTPFTRPGMPGPYDIRQWHTPAGKASK